MSQESEQPIPPSAPRPVDEMWSELQARVGRVENAPLQQLLAVVLERHGDKLRVWPAAMMVHHAYRGGLLEHVLKLTEVGDALARAYGVDADLVFAGAVLHDVGKIEELSGGEATSYSTRGNLIGHIALGVMLVRDASRTIDEFPDDLLTRIEHLILSHHGARERGSPVTPMTEEAFILASIDDLDATLHQFRRHVGDDPGEGELTSYHPRLRRVLLKPAGR